MNKFSLFLKCHLLLTFITVTIRVNGAPSLRVVDNLCIGTVVESILDKYTKSLQDVLEQNGQEFYVESIGSVVRSCPFKSTEYLIGGQINCRALVCFNVTDLTINVSQLIFSLFDFMFIKIMIRNAIFS